MWFSKLDTYDKIDPKVWKQQLATAYHLGNGGTETNQKAVDDMNKLKADVAALTRAQQLLNDYSQGSKVQRALAERLAQDNKWLAHYTKLVAETKRGYDTLKAAAKALVDEAFAAGKVEAEKELKAKKPAGDLQGKSDKNDGKTVDPKFQATANENRRDDRNNGGNNNQNKNNDDKNKGNNNNGNQNRAPVNLNVRQLIVVDSKKGKKKLEGLLQKK